MIPACAGKSRTTGNPSAGANLSAPSATRLLSGQLTAATVGCPARSETGTAPSTGSPSGVAADERAMAADISGNGTKASATTGAVALAVAPDDPVSGVVCHESTGVLSAPVMLTCTVVIVPSAEARVKVSDTDWPALRLPNALLAV